MKSFYENFFHLVYIHSYVHSPYMQYKHARKFNASLLFIKHHTVWNFNHVSRVGRS
jgi:hypothetical protein